MFPSVCDAAKGRAVKKLWPAALLCLSILLVTLYKSCRFCNSEVLWLSIYHTPSSSSFLKSARADLSRPSSRPVLVPEPQHNFSDYKLGENDADSASATTAKASNDNSTLTSEVLNSEDPGDAVRLDEKAQNVSHSGEFYRAPADRHAGVLDRSGDQSPKTRKPSRLDEKAQNVSHSGEFYTGPTDRHAGVLDRSGDQSPKVSRMQEPPASAVQRANMNAVRVPAGTNLQARIYHNLSMFIKSYELMEKTFKIYTYREGLPPLVHTGPTVGIYGSEGRFILQLQSSKRFATSDPNKAHLFFMPYSVTNMVQNIYVPDSHDMHPLIRFITNYVDLIASKYPYWNRSHGADHFFVSCHDWGPATARKNTDLRRNGIKVVCNADEKEEFVVGKDVSLLETYLHAVKPPTRLGGPTARKRPYLAFFAGQMHGRVRPILLQHWKEKDPDMRIYERIPKAIAKKTSYVKHMKMSKFCICPMGYEVNSPRIVESIYYDCVPVIIADNFVLPFSDVLNWQAFSVSVAEQDVPRLKQILLSIPQTKYTALQANLKHVRQHFAWHYKLPVKYDVFHMILHSLWLRQRSL